jgi:2TM domain
MTATPTDESLEEARHYVRRKRIFIAVLAIWLVLSAIWLLIDLRDDSSSWWFYWPMLGTGTAVAVTGIVLLGVGGLCGADWERREIREAPPPSRRRAGRLASMAQRR